MKNEWKKNQAQNPYIKILECGVFLFEKQKFLILDRRGAEL